MRNLSERDTQAEKLAQEIIELARNSIIINLRFMDRAAGNLKFIPDMNHGFAGSGSVILYSPWTVLKSFMEEEPLVTRNMLHSMLHNVFRHSFTGEGIDKAKWNLASDIAVENAINELDKDFLTVRREEKQKEIIEYLKEKVGYLTAERIYSFICDDTYSIIRIPEWAAAFAGDGHELWYGGDRGDVLDPDIDLEQLWKDISRKMLKELDALSKSDNALTQNLRDINRVRYNYTEFLRHFGLHHETMRLSEEEFDNNYYTYGLELYGNIPLIEPLEYRDNKNIKDFVIAIDTSGSVQGEVVQKFIQHTHDVLAERNSFDTRINLYILQCDDAIRDVAHITSPDEFGSYFKDRKISGLGRTDFRPVFEFTDKLIQEGKLKDFRGVLYFTDGKGTFPEKAPGYDVAFIIHSDSLNEVWVPEWALKMQLPTEEIMNL